MRGERLAESKRRVSRILSIWRAQTPFHAYLFDDDGRIAHQMRYARQSCSCPMCGNPRKHFHKRTRQELIAEESMKEEIDTLSRIDK